jgi:phage-related protein
MPAPAHQLKPLFWVRSAKRDFMGFPASVKDGFGFELFLVQSGLHPPSAKRLKGFGGGVLELAGDEAGDTYRAVYTVRFPRAIYVLHAFKKKARRGIATPKNEIEMVRRRLRDAEEDYARQFGEDCS